MTACGGRAGPLPRAPVRLRSCQSKRRAALIRQISRAGRTPPGHGHCCLGPPSRPLALAFLRSGLKRLLTHCGGCLRASGRPRGFLCSRHRGS